MLLTLWDQLLYFPLINGLIAINMATGNFGWSIVLFTVLLRLAMTPLVLPGLKISKKVAELAPDLARLREKHKEDKQALLAAQAELYKKHGANPAAGCLPQIIQLLILIALFNSLNLLLNSDGASLSQKLRPILYSMIQIPENFTLNNRFFYLDLSQPDIIKIPGFPLPLPGLFLLLSGLIQFISGKMMIPVVETEKKVAEKTHSNTDDMAVAVQQQMLYLMPLMTLIIGYQFASGLILYWLVFSLVSSIQQYSVTGWGGMAPWIKRLNLLKSR